MSGAFITLAVLVLVAVSLMVLVAISDVRHRTRQSAIRQTKFWRMLNGDDSLDGSSMALFICKLRETLHKLPAVPATEPSNQWYTDRATAIGKALHAERERDHYIDRTKPVAYPNLNEESGLTIYDDASSTVETPPRVSTAFVQLLSCYQRMGLGSVLPSMSGSVNIEKELSTDRQSRAHHGRI